MLHRWVRNFFGFSRSQTNAFLVLLPLLTLIIFSAPAYRWWVSHRTEDFSSEQLKLDSLITLWNVPKKDSLHEMPEATSGGRLYAFDPNKVSETEFQTLGFPKKLAIRITHYREKGGRFSVKSDLLKIYGVDSAFYWRLFPFIQLPEKKEQKNEYAQATPKATRTPERFDLNEADTSQLKKIYGIGEKLSLRIIKYRDVLGGFVTMTQVSEIYGLDTTVVNRLIKASFVDQNFEPRRINVNTATEKDLSAHPYLKGNAAKAIVAYRFQHGEIRAVEDLQNIQSIDPRTIQKMAPYLEFRN